MITAQVESQRRWEKLISLQFFGLGLFQLYSKNPTSRPIIIRQSDPHPRTHPHPSQPAPPNKLKKQFPGWLRLQQSIAEGEAKPQMMVGSKVYAESVHSGHPESYTFLRNLANML